MSKSVVVLAVASFVALGSHLAAADTDAPQLKSRETAFALSAGGTALSIGLVLGGAQSNNGTMVGVGLLSSLVTPSLGEFYAGKPVTVGMGIRAASAVVTLAGVSEALKCLDANDTCQNNDAEVAVLLGTGVIGYATGTIYDIASAGSAVDEFNKKYDIHIAPTVIHGAPGSTAAGMGISGRF